jgi:DNA-binding transcriptional LysR family regulator
MDLKQLEYFVHVAEMGSFTRAAAFLQVAQPALSRQVRTLEVELRQPLLDRNGRGVTLTEAGKRLLAHARGILQQVQRARDDLEDQRGAATGRLAIALPPSVSRTLTAPLVKAFREQLPRANLSVVEGLSTYALEWLVIGRVDCAVVYNVTPSPAIDLQPLLDEPLYLVSARGPGRAHGQAHHPARGGRARTGHSEPAAFDAHAARGGAGRRGLPRPGGAGDRERAGHPGPGAAGRVPRRAGRERHPHQRPARGLPAAAHRPAAAGGHAVDRDLGAAPARAADRAGHPALVPGLLCSRA